MLERKTEIGYIRFSKGVINRVIDDAVSECGGRVTLQNFKGRYKSYIPGSDEIRVSENSDGIHVDIYIVIRFGASIKENTNKMLDYIDDNLMKLMGEKPAETRIIITGVQSRNIARRNIVVSRVND